MAVLQVPWPSGFDDRNSVSPSSAGRKSMIRVSVGLAPSEDCGENLSPASPLAPGGLRHPLTYERWTLCAFALSSFCTCLSLCPNSSFCEDTRLAGLGPTSFQCDLILT